MERRLRRSDGREPARIFESKDERDRWQVQTYGAVKDGFRRAEDATDERPLLIDPYPFWRDWEEERRYTRAIRVCPPSTYGHLDVFEYLSEVAKVATGQTGRDVVKAMPIGDRELPRGDREPGDEGW